VSDAMRAFQQPLLIEFAQIVANGLRRDTEMRGQIINAHPVTRTHKPQNFIMTLGNRHAVSSGLRLAGTVIRR
jgi:hypothetical protein